MRIIVTGAGIGGSVLALALEQAGMDYVVLEQAPALTEVGAGIQLGRITEVDHIRLARVLSSPTHDTRLV